MRTGLIMLATAATLGTAAVATPASAQYYHHGYGYHHGYHHGGDWRRDHWRYRHEHRWHGGYHHRYRGYYGHHRR